MGIDLGKFKGPSCPVDTGTTEAGSTTTPADAADPRTPTRVEQPDSVVFEIRTVAAKVAVTCDEPTLHSLVDEPMHEASSRREFERNVTEGGKG